jgi:ribosomal protein S21
MVKTRIHSWMFKTPLQKNGTLSTLRQVLASNSPMVSWKRQSRQSKRVWKRHMMVTKTLISPR